MKKSILTAMLFLAVALNAGAQKSQDEKWSLTTGPVLAFPLKYLHDFHSFGVGVDIAALHPIASGFSLGGRANYAYFFGKQTGSNSGTVSSHYDATHLLNLLGEVNYMFECNVIVGLDLGLGVTLTHATGDASFARILYVGYQAKMKSPVVFALYFDQTDFQKNIGLRAGFPI